MTLMSKLFDLSGKTALITGASRGLGLAIARAYAEHGADLIIASRKLDACETAAREIAAQTGRRVLPLACHVGHWQDCDHLVEQSYAHFGRIDVLVNNAGMSPLYPSLDTVTEELWDKVQAVNLKGPFRLSAIVAKRMVEGTGGSIICISSSAAVQPTLTELPYAMAKLALHAMTQGIAHNYRGKVRANIIMPGAFATDISKAWPDSLKRQIGQLVPMGRAGDPNEIVGAALYLASDAASYTNGAVIKVDGGLAYGVG
jgi:NAD(P)-dependent dehydrogenase (short-subunit alcohol dehydrogenase family)